MGLFVTDAIFSASKNLEIEITVCDDRAVLRGMHLFRRKNKNEFPQKLNFIHPKSWIRSHIIPNHGIFQNLVVLQFKMRCQLIVM